MSNTNSRRKSTATTRYKLFRFYPRALENGVREMHKTSDDQKPAVVGLRASQSKNLARVKTKSKTPHRMTKLAVVFFVAYAAAQTCTVAEPATSPLTYTYLPTGIITSVGFAFGANMPTTTKVVVTNGPASTNASISASIIYRSNKGIAGFNVSGSVVGSSAIFTFVKDAYVAPTTSAGATSAISGGATSQGGSATSNNGGSTSTSPGTTSDSSDSMGTSSEDSASLNSVLALGTMFLINDDVLTYSVMAALAVTGCDAASDCSQIDITINAPAGIDVGCTDGTFVNCTANFATSAGQLCTGGVYGTCMAGACTTNYILVNGACVECAYSTQSNPYQSCRAGNGFGNKTCQMNGFYSACSCATGCRCDNGNIVDPSLDKCVLCISGSTGTCPILNGIGTRNCSSTGSWGGCSLLSCNLGYANVGGACSNTCVSGTTLDCYINNSVAVSKNVVTCTTSNTWGPCTLTQGCNSPYVPLPNSTGCANNPCFGVVCFNNATCTAGSCPPCPVPLFGDGKTCITSPCDTIVPACFGGCSPTGNLTNPGRSCAPCPPCFIGDGINCTRGICTSK
jgi:hypothetical protein